MMIMIGFKAGFSLVVTMFCVGTASVMAGEKRAFESYADFKGYNNVADLTVGEIYFISAPGVSGSFTLHDDATTSINDDAIILQHNVLSGYYLKRVVADQYNVQWWGANGNDSGDDLAAIESAIKYVGGKALVSRWTLHGLR